MGRYQVHQKDGTQDALVDWLTTRGCRYTHLGRPVDGLLAIPVKGGWRTVLVEFKTRTGRLRASQQAFLDHWPGDWYVLRVDVDCAAMLSEMRYLDPKRAGLT